MRRLAEVLQSCHLPAGRAGEWHIYTSAPVGAEYRNVGACGPYQAIGLRSTYARLGADHVVTFEWSCVMNRSLPTKLEGKSAISVAFVFALAAPLAAEDRDPRQRTGPQASDPAVLVTGLPALLQDHVVAGSPAAGQIRLTPVATHPGGSYNTAGYYTSANITGQRLRVGPGGGRTYWNMQVSDWSPFLMNGWQGTIADSGLLGTGNLTYPQLSCATSAECTSAFGEVGSQCQTNVCMPAFVNKARADWTHAGLLGAIGDAGHISSGYVSFAVATEPEWPTDAGLDYYGGTLVIDVPPTAQGLYTLGFVPLPDTFLFDRPQPPSAFPFATMTPGELEVVSCLCNADVNNNGFVNAIDEAIVLDCIHGNCGGCVNDCDVNCDGAIDWVDMGVVRCKLMGFLDCCNAATGACLGMNVGTDYEPCQVTTTMTCSRYLGTYLGNDSTCDGCVCNADVNNNGKVQATDTACVRDCAQYNLCACCVNGCDVNCDGGVDYTDLAAVFCEHQGSTNCCNVAIGACTIPTGGWPDCIETSQSPCQFFGGTYYGNGSTCAQICAVTRVFEDENYCPGRVDLVRLKLGSLAGVSAISVADSPPTGWTVGAISNGGAYDAVNHKVKWGPLFSPFLAELTYEVTPNEAAAGQQCFSGVISVDGVNRAFCGDDCLNYQCCPYIAAETPQPVCGSCAVGNCNACTNGSCQDGSVSLCEVIAYGCAWVRGCNDDIATVTRAAYIWRNGECYCWDDAIQNFVPTACGAGSTCCHAGGAAAVLEVNPVDLGNAQARLTRNELRGTLRDWQVSIDVAPVMGTAAAAVELIVPHGWTVIAIGEGGAFDHENGKIKWGPYIGDEGRTLTATVVPGVGSNEGKVRLAKDAVRRGLRGTVSFDGVNSPVTITR